jgi:signal transduction histidine kinase
MHVARGALVLVYRSAFPGDIFVAFWNCLNLKKLLLLLLFLWAQAAMALQVRDDIGRVNLSEVVEVLEDPSGQLSLAQVQSPDMASRFAKRPSPGNSLNLGFTASTYWLRFPLSKSANSRESWLLEVFYPNLDLVEFHPPYGYPVVTGRTQPIASRPVLGRFFVFPLALQAQEQYHYMRVATQGDLTVPLRVSSTKTFLSDSQRELSLQFLYYGGLLVLCLYNLFVYYFVREKLFLLYAAYAASLGMGMGMGMMAGNGYARLFLWPDWMAFDATAQYFFFALAGGLLISLMRGFVAPNRNSPFALVCRLSATVYYAISAILLSSVWLHFNTLWVNQALMLCSGVAVLVIVVGVFLAWRSGRSGLRFFMVSWLVLAVGVCTAVARMEGWVQTNPVTAYALQLSSILEMFFLFLALADQWRVERNIRLQAQRNELEFRDLYTASLRISKEALEETVQQRTAQLELSLLNEQETLAQYMRFGSMISHEFRNPLAIIRSQLSLMRREHELGHLELEQRLSVMDSATHRLTRMFDKWLQSDQMNNLLADIAPCTLHLAEWLHDYEQSNVHSLTGLRIQLQLDPSVQSVVVDEYLLEIALSNLIDNARKYAGPDKSVRIETRRKPGFVGIAVVDQGPGIALEHQVVVFEDYFRISSQSGPSGMGLGLSIVRRIARAHLGDLELHSVLGQGCSFCIWLPEKNES